MAQFGRPSTDTTREAWEDQAGGTVNIYTTIDESVASDTDYVRSALVPTTDAYVTKLTTIEDPQSSTGHIVRYRYSKDASGGAQIDIVVQLRQGYVSEASLGTLIHSETHTNVGNTWTAGTFTLSAAEADTITDYSDLFIRITANQV